MVKARERLGNYEVATAADGSAQVLGAGTGGITYCGRHIHLGTEVAIKVLVRRKNLFQKDRDAFLSEARAAASLTHPQIAQIFDFGESAQQHPYYVMELCEGGSLETFGLKTLSVDEYSRTQWFFEAAAALAHAHQKGILHRDIKPSNLLIARQNEAATLKLIDFGLADHTEPSETSDQVIGTPHFAAPEQLRGNAETASDVFSLGATFLWLITGQHLSQGDLNNVIAERLNATSYALQLSELTDPWQTLLGQMLEIDPALRPRDGAEVLSALHRAFPDHIGRLVAWDSTESRPDASTHASLPSHWQDFPAIAWTERWAAAENPRPIPFGVALRASRPGTSDLHEVHLFNDLAPTIVEVLTLQADLVARHASDLGLGTIHLERSEQWWSIAWPALGFDDALSWVRRGQATSIAEMLAALDPIATALDGMKAGGFAELEIHPSMLIVAEGLPLKFSLAVPLPLLESQDRAVDSGGTMRGATGTSLAARFASCVYQLLSGRTPPPAAFLNVKAYQAIPKLSERANRFLASAIAGTLSNGTSRDIIRGLAYEERIPGASYSGTLTSSGSRSSERWQNPPAASSPAPPVFTPPPPPVFVQPPTPAVVPPPAVATPPPAVFTAPPPIVFTPPVNPPPPSAVLAQPPSLATPPPAITPPRKKSSLLPVLASLAAVILLTLTLALWWYMPQLKKWLTPSTGVVSTPISKPSIVQEPTIAEKTAVAVVPPVKNSTERLSLVNVPSDASTISAAIQRCSAGGTIEISSGTHAEALVLTQSISIVSKSSALIEDGGLGSSMITIRGPIQVTLRNLQIRNTQKQVSAGVETSPPLVLIADGAKVIFEGCVIESSVGDGISLADKASATFSNCRIRKNRGNGIRVSSGSQTAVSLSEIQENGGSGLTVENVDSSATLRNGTSITSNSEHGIEISNGGQLSASGVEIKSNQKVGLIVENGGSNAKLDAACLISDNHKFGIGVRNFGHLELKDATLEDNTENGIYLESGGHAEVSSSRFKSNGAIGLYLVGGTASAITVEQSTFESHSDAGIAVVEGSAKVSGCRFLNNQMALFYGNGSSGSAITNTIFPGPLADAIVTENAGSVTLTDNTLGTDR